MPDMEITVSKSELLDKLRANRAKHRKVFEDALEGYRQHAEDVLRDHITMLLKGKAPRVQIILSMPEDHTRDYDRVIGMLLMHRGDTFDLDERMYRQYVDDDWQWKREWLDTSKTYAGDSVARNYGQ